MSLVFTHYAQFTSSSLFFKAKKNQLCWFICYPYPYSSLMHFYLLFHSSSSFINKFCFHFEETWQFLPKKRNCIFLMKSFFFPILRYFLFFFWPRELLTPFKEHERERKRIAEGMIFFFCRISQIFFKKKSFLCLIKYFCCNCNGKIGSHDRNSRWKNNQMQSFAMFKSFLELDEEKKLCNSPQTCENKHRKKNYF